MTMLTLFGSGVNVMADRCLSELCLMIIPVQSVWTEHVSKKILSMLHTSLGLNEDILGVMFHALFVFLLFLHLNAFDFVVCVNVQEWPCLSGEGFLRAHCAKCAVAAKRILLILIVSLLQMLRFVWNRTRLKLCCCKLSLCCCKMSSTEVCC